MKAQYYYNIALFFNQLLTATNK